MNIRIFQIVVPAAALILIWLYIGRVRRGKSTVADILPTVTFLIGTGVFALFPDLISDFIARIFGVKSNINAIIFFGMGLLSLIQLNLYSNIRKQEKEITRLTQELAISEFRNRNLEA